jgi:hypothetical protein
MLYGTFFLIKKGVPEFVDLVVYSTASKTLEGMNKLL